MQHRFHVLLLIAATLMTQMSACVPEPNPDRAVSVPANIDHGAWDDLLKKYVDDRGLVSYDEWKRNENDRLVLDAYLEQFSPSPSTPARGEDLQASLINAYNAFTISWILQHYPVASIHQTPEPFTGKHHMIGGREVSLDEIEHHTLRPSAGYRVHAVLVCAARSCPPLQRFAIIRDRLDEQLEQTFRVWLGREDLNRFYPDDARVEISQIFNWFKADFDDTGGIPAVLRRYGPEQYANFLADGDFSISYVEYDWGLNDQGEVGTSYNTLRLARDWLKNFLGLR